jgi:hypothetical protein
MVGEDQLVGAGVRSSRKGLARNDAGLQRRDARANSRCATHHPQALSRPRGSAGVDPVPKASHPSVNIRMDFGEDHGVEVMGRYLNHWACPAFD